MSTPAPKQIVVNVIREPFSDWLELHEDGVGTEELEIEDVRKWFDNRGANMYEVEKALDYCWNFGSVQIVIKNPIEPKPKYSGFSPKI